MGFEIKRVDRAFDWPLGDVWQGYINPHLAEQEPCSACDQTGYNAVGNLLLALWMRLNDDGAALVDLAQRMIDELGGVDAVPAGFAVWLAGQLARPGSWHDNLDWDDVAVLVQEQRLVHTCWAGAEPTPNEVNAWFRQRGHDAINRVICIEARGRRYGLEVACPICGGERVVPNPKLDARISAWTAIEPPAGDGWQLWETITEGSPKSPVFPSAEALIAWLVAERGYSPQTAQRLVARGGAVSTVIIPGVGVYEGAVGEAILEVRHEARERKTEW